jgi:hypothetical protein
MLELDVLLAQRRAQKLAWKQRAGVLRSDAWLDEARAGVAHFSLPGFERLVDWLQERRDLLPCPEPSVVHWDFHPFNILLRGAPGWSWRTVFPWPSRQRRRTRVERRGKGTFLIRRTA